MSKDGRQHITGRARAQTNTIVDDATRALTQAYARSWNLIRDDLLRAATEAATAAAQDGDITAPAAYRRAARLQAVLSALALQEQQLAARHGIVIGQRLNPVVALPPDVLAHVLAGAGLGHGTGPDPRALEAIVVRSTQRIEALSQPLPAAARQAVADGLVRGVAAGDHPTRVARQIVDTAREAFGGQLTRALVIARTELIDASRASTQASYRASSEVQGWVWQATGGPRTCPACLGMSGTTHPVTEILQGHPQCRCVMIPRLRGETVTDTGVLTGDDLLEQLTPAERVHVLGPTRSRLVDAGLPVRDLAVRQSNPGWRPSYQVRAVHDLPDPEDLRGHARTVAAGSSGGGRGRRSAGGSGGGGAGDRPPVSDAARIVTTTPAVRAAYRTALDAIDRVHTDGALDPLPFRDAPPGHIPLGTYRFQATTGKALDLLLRADGPWPALSTVHEVGHWLDHQTMHRPGRLGSRDRPNPEWGAVMRAITSSRAVQDLHRVPDGDEDATTHAAYLLRPHEMWARAYAQYVALRSADPILGRDLDAARAVSRKAAQIRGFRVPDQWDAEDFTPIAAAIDDLFAHLGWRRP